MQTALGTVVAQVWFPFLEQRAHQQPESDREGESSLRGVEATFESHSDTDGWEEGEEKRKCSTPKS